MANKNTTLGAAKVAKKDEFYTQLRDIEVELVHYRDYFRNKIVFCNCDDPYESNFFKYFALNFNALGLKKLIATCYDGSPIAQQELPLFEDEDSEPKRKAYKVEISEVPDLDGNGATDLTDVQLLLKSSEHNVKAELKGNGDFRSPECIELLKQADVVVTNPPFSLFREYVAQLVKYDKKFIIIGNKNAITYKEVFPLIAENKLWIGHTPMSKDLHFMIPKSYQEEFIANKKEGSAYVIKNGVVLGRSQSIWFTNIDYKERHEDLILIKKYSPEEYPMYDNYDAINVNKTDDIPDGYPGIMGVPITFLDKYNPEQFEIIGITKTWFGGACKIYPEQIQIDKSGKKSKVSKLNDGPAIQVEDISRYTTYYIVDGKKYIQTYARILIRNKKPQTI
jgi:hypothetical protein